MGRSKPPPDRGSGPITGSDWSFGINARSANPMTDAALLEEISLKLRGYYTALTEQPLPEHLLEILERFPTDPHGTPGDPRR
jgi:Anti-sigma factor NepR